MYKKTCIQVKLFYFYPSRKQKLTQTKCQHQHLLKRITALSQL
jgi:hypothetical protein